MDDSRQQSMELSRWKALPSRLAAGVGLFGFSLAVLNGMLAGNEPVVILVRAMLAMIVCWALAWCAGTMIVLAVSHDSSGDAPEEPSNGQDDVQDLDMNTADSITV
jgi:hypothetical protein